MKRKTRKDSNSGKLYYAIGEDNFYPHFLLDLKSKSTLLGSAIGAVGDVAKGKGSLVSATDPNEAALFRAWLKNIGANFEFEEMLFNSLSTFWGGYIELKFADQLDENTNREFKLVNVKALKYAQWRVGCRDEMMRVRHYWFHPNFYSKRVATNKLRAFAKYPGIELIKRNQTTVFKKDLKDAFYEGKQTLFSKDRYVVFIKQPSDLSEEYPKTSFETESALNAAVLDFFLPQFDVASMENGLSIAHIVNIPLLKPRRNNAEEMEKYLLTQKKLTADLKSSIQGVENTDNILVMFSDPTTKNEPITITAVPNNNNASTLTEKDERKERTLLNAFRVSHPALIGISQRSGKGLTNISGMLTEADNQWYVNFVSKVTRLAETFYNETLIPIYEKEIKRVVPGLNVTFPRNIRFKYIPSDAIQLAVMTTRQIWKHYELGPYTDAAREELIRDLQDRAVAMSTITMENAQNDPRLNDETDLDDTQGDTEN